VEKTEIVYWCRTLIWCDEKFVGCYSTLALCIDATIGDDSQGVDTMERAGCRKTIGRRMCRMRWGNKDCREGRKLSIDSHTAVNVCIDWRDISRENGVVHRNIRKGEVWKAGDQKSGLWQPHQQEQVSGVWMEEVGSSSDVILWSQFPNKDSERSKSRRMNGTSFSSSL
jgi:hypothetical protein